MKKFNQKWTTPIKVLLVGTGIAVAAMLVPMVVSALAPAANTVIGNQAAASYTDASGIPQTVKSNQVSTTVAQVGGVTLTNAGDKTAAAGNVVYIPHSLINTGTCVVGSNCDLGQGPTPNPTFTESANPGTPVQFPIYIKNQDSTTGTYNLTAAVPPGWTVKFVPSSGTCASAAVAQPVSVTAGNQVEVLACVTPPAGTTPGTTNVQITATSSTDPTVKDTITDAVQVTQPVVPNMQLGPVNSTSTTPDGGTTVVPVTLTNTGTASCGLNGGFNVSVSLDTASKAAGWTAVVFYDGGTLKGAIDSTDTLIDTTVATANLTSTIASAFVPLAPAPGNTAGLPLLVKLFAPTNATIGSTATATLTVKDLNSNSATACPNAVGTYSDTVTNGQLSVQKTQVLSAGSGTTGSLACSGAVSTGFAVTSLKANPGDCIVYQVVATNQGNAPVTNVTLSDAVPAYTVYNATTGTPQPATQCVATGNSGTPTLTQTGTGAATTSVSCGLTGGTGVTLSPLGTMTLYYAVQVQQ